MGGYALGFHVDTIQDISHGKDEDPALWLRLIRSRRVGPITFHRMIKDYGGAEQALAALPGIAKAAGIDGYEICPMGVVHHELAQGRKAGANMIVWGDAIYPANLHDVVDAPPILWALGDPVLLARPMIAMIGARNASSLGVRMASRLAEGLGAAGQVIVSGLARGIDAAAHEASVATGTIAVHAGGVDVVYPEENATLADQIRDMGLRLSEQPPGLQPQSRHFPVRNRIVSGLCRAVVVVEATSRSGSLITAKAAADQGRDVLVVPGHPLDARAAGCNQLIREGATLVRNTADIIEALRIAPITAIQPIRPHVNRAALRPPMPLPGPVPVRRPLADISEVHSQILARLGPSPLAEDQLIRDLAMSAGTLATALMTLELDGRVSRLSGGLLTRSD
ncbi:MAG: DNA-protecting protein DprA [Pseudomonadota bacterium]